MNYKKVTRSGNVLEVELIENCRIVNRKVVRNQNRQRTPEKQKERNYFNAIRKLSRVINANFMPGDLFLTLTYRGKKQPTFEQAEKDMQKFLRSIRTIRRLRGLPELKFVSVIEQGTEEEQKRIHIHIIMNAMSIDEVNDIWHHGKVLTSRLEADGEYTGLAHYISKEPRREHKKRWSQSRNLTRPEPEYEEIKKSELEKEIPTPRGYVKKYENYSYIEEIGRYRYAKFIKIGKYDLSMGEKEIEIHDES